MKVSLLKQFREFDRSIEINETMLYHSYNIISQIVFDGIIKTPVELYIFNGRALLAEGNHRLTAAEIMKIEDIPTKIIIKGKLKGHLKDIYYKFKPI